MKNIVLIGMMGSGKSFVGRALSQCLKMNFIDLDEYIESREELKIREIFQKFGEKTFRKIERECFFSFIEESNLVIATGGGIILNESNLYKFQKNSHIIYLDGSVEYIYSNIKDDTSRPLLENKDKLEEINKILKFRKPLYRKLSHYQIDVSFRNVEDIIEDIIGLIS